MNTFYYRINNGNLHFVSPESDVKICSTTEKIAVLYDRTHGGVIKHGNSKDVDSYYQNMKNVLKGNLLEHDIIGDLGFVEMETNPETVDHLNKCISTTGYVLEITRTLH